MSAPVPVEIVCVEVASVGEMYACVVDTSTITASAALKSWLPSAVFDLSSASPFAPAVCFELPRTDAPSAGLPEQPEIPVKCVSSLAV